MILKDRVIVVTGASHGLGAAISMRCAEAGALLALVDIDGSGIQAHAQRLGSDRTLPVTCDVSRLPELRRLVTEVVTRWGRIDGVVNNAGVNFVKPFLETKESEWDHVINVDLKGSFFLTQYCAQQMIEQRPRGGAVVQIASVHTLASLSGAGPYDAAKHGVVGFSKAAAIELASQDVRINILSPGLCRTKIWTDIVHAAPSEAACREYWNANIPAERLIEPAEIADVVVFLLSDQSRCVMGANLIADLGMTSLLVSREPYYSTPIQG